jgi:hypothetical protein
MRTTDDKLIAINVLLEPDRTMTDKSKSLNARLPMDLCLREGVARQDKKGLAAPKQTSANPPNYGFTP